jgi:5-methylcytosine-specific restriction endonuclease McrA
VTVDPAFKREQFRDLKRANDNGQLVPPKRKKLSAKTRQAVLLRQRGDCAACHEPITDARFDVDHITERDLMGGDDVSNLEALHVGCHRLKTSARAKDLAKVHRLADVTWEEPSDKPSRLQSRNEWPKGQKLQSRGFEPSRRVGR